ncbi:unnamed protein product [marine sediment metagenome]|uniref:Uncharacterized protein n=3 Tax=marine sediment metagenome TaxID=412755 RepID=X0YJK2_9ZZZZ
MGIKSVLWNEDIDTSGGAADVAAALVAGIRGGFTLTGTDIVNCPDVNGMRIIGICCGGESVLVGPGILTCAQNVRSPYSFASVYGQSGAYQQWGMNIPIPPRATLGVVGAGNGGAEQSNTAIFIDDPSVGDPWNFSAPNQWDEVLMVRPTSAARVADTQSGHTDICGRAVAYTDAQTAIPADRDITIQVIDALVDDAAGYGEAGLYSHKANGANMDLVGCVGFAEYYNMMDIFGGLPTCTADDPFQFYGAGVGVAAMTLTQLTLGLTY